MKIELDKVEYDGACEVYYIEVESPILAKNTISYRYPNQAIEFSEEDYEGCIKELPKKQIVSKIELRFLEPWSSEGLSDKSRSTVEFLTKSTSYIENEIVKSSLELLKFYREDYLSVVSARDKPRMTKALDFLSSEAVLVNTFKLSSITVIPDGKIDNYRYALNFNAAWAGFSLLFTGVKVEKIGQLDDFG